MLCCYLTVVPGYLAAPSILLHDPALRFPSKSKMQQKDRQRNKHFSEICVDIISVIWPFTDVCDSTLARQGTALLSASMLSTTRWLRRGILKSHLQNIVHHASTHGAQCWLLANKWKNLGITFGHVVYTEKLAAPCTLNNSSRAKQRRLRSSTNFDVAQQ